MRAGLLQRGCIAEDVCLRPGKTIVFIGDSLTRYQYLDLVYSLHHRSRHFMLRPRENPLIALTFRTWMAFLNGTNADLSPNEACDCYRAGRSNTFRPERICENRLYSAPCCSAHDGGKHSLPGSRSRQIGGNSRRLNGTCGNQKEGWSSVSSNDADGCAGGVSGSSNEFLRIAYFSAFAGSAPVSGHLPLDSDLWSWRPDERVLRLSQWNQSLWQYAKWEDLIEKVVARLQPTAIVLNAGLHPLKGLDLGRIRDAAAAAARCVVYKTTTPTRSEVNGLTHESAAVRAFEKEARQLFAHDILLESRSLLAGLNRSDYADTYHFVPVSAAYQTLNVALIRSLEASCPDWMA